MLSGTKMHVHSFISSSVQYSYSSLYSSPCFRCFWPLFSHILLCLPFAFFCPHYFTILLSLRVGPSIAMSRTNGPVSRLVPSCICSVLYLYDLVLYSMVSPSFPFDNTFRVLPGLAPALVPPCSRLLPRFLRFPVYNCHITWRCASKQCYPSPHLLVHHPYAFHHIPCGLRLRFLDFWFCARARLCIPFQFCMKPQ